ncbi:DeoR/GlpR family DNA-binding transcription regulator [Jatrophihabitans sp. GAS493]|uniref:DeoR/GlpR family DNA-binding transcription regulator n=1 Tax=Jatrophihabitans sp. GAS493 TaxID=1907575 RepID=UPI000BB96C19|nr:DeoR/GlpR family DNA-binding transcription regulator [Jatrophihabitans sp. GAS493]
MDATERSSRLVDALRRNGRIDVSWAALEFGTAEMTIRRDLDLLVDRGVARRVRGGAVSLLMRGEELPFGMRELDAVETKRRIAAAVANLIDDGEAVALDSGTTVTEVARSLADRRLVAMPLSLHAAMALAGSSSARLMMPGGETRPGELSMIGPLALASIAALRFDTAVLGCCGVSPEGQVTAHDLGDMAVKQALFASSRRRILALDGSKFSQAALAVVCAVSDFDIVVTDQTAPESATAPLEKAGVVVHRV